MSKLALTPIHRQMITITLIVLVLAVVILAYLLVSLESGTRTSLDDLAHQIFELRNEVQASR